MCSITLLQNVVENSLPSPVVQEIFATEASSTDEIQVNLHENIRMKIHQKLGKHQVTIKLQN